MSKPQIRKFIGWIVFYVILPIMVYPTTGLIAYFSGTNTSFTDIIVKGDSLFLVVILIATTIDIMALDFLKSPGEQHDDNLLKYITFIFMILALPFYCMMYGWLLSMRLQPSQVIKNSDTWANFCAYSTAAFALVCGAVTFEILRTERS
jgi:hypothetical protein